MTRQPRVSTYIDRVRFLVLVFACLLLVGGQPAEPSSSVDDMAQVIADDVAVLPVVLSTAIATPPSVRIVPVAPLDSAGRLHCPTVFRPPRVA